ncbi:uncharacterized protein I303_102044 [Kwoniella dejecticola CBS 10117]|uniref:WW domain-containing protein n=1 Tax=Kwoniella dejecticola CBS 10117 TaxID=1296121 RepID=A0A1A6AC24_9TREE|nr:uncharacterized protein I303_01817 [Kwoniella dejecticola CBS 10117]OBR87609.1 hypothetical protein I303_01817 [Kwoniella dejecticola CBS 10117]
MADEEVDWDDDWRAGGPAHPVEVEENGNGDHSALDKQEDDVLSLDGLDPEWTCYQLEKAKHRQQALEEPVPRRTATSAGSVSSASHSNGNGNGNGGSSPLPPGWTAIMSKSHNRHFFFHKETNSTVWEKPSLSDNKNEAELQKEDGPASPPLAKNGTAADQANPAPRPTPTTAQAQNQTADKIEKPVGTGKAPPTGPSEKREQVRGIETKPHYDKYWAQRDNPQSQPQGQGQDRIPDKEKRRAREPSPPQSAQDHKRFRGDNGGNEARRQPELKPLQDYKPAQPSSRPSDTPSAAPDKPRDDPRTRPYNGAYVPPVIRHPVSRYGPPPRSPPRSRGSITPSHQPSSGPRYRDEYSRAPAPLPPSSDYRRDDYLSRPPPSSRHDPAPYASSRGPPPRSQVEEAEVERERAKIRDEARKAQEKLEFLKQAEARLEREMSEKQRRPIASDHNRDPYPSARSSRPSPYDHPGPRPVDDRRPYPPSRGRNYSPPPPSSRYDRGPDPRYEASSRGYAPESRREGTYDSRERERPPPRGYEGRPPPRGEPRGGYGYDDRPYDSRAPPPFRSRSRSRPNSPPPLSSRYSDGRRSPPPFKSRLGPRPDSPPRRDLSSRIGGGGRGRSELAAEPMSAQAIDRERDRRSPPPLYRDRPRGGPASGAGSGPARPLAERMSFDDRRGPR